MINNKVKKTAKWFLDIFNDIQKCNSDRARLDKLTLVAKGIINVINIARERAVNENQFRENLLESLNHCSEYLYKELTRNDLTGVSKIRMKFTVNETENEEGITNQIKVVYGYGLNIKSVIIDIPRAFKEENYRG